MPDVPAKPYGYSSPQINMISGMIQPDITWKVCGSQPRHPQRIMDDKNHSCFFYGIGYWKSSLAQTSFLALERLTQPDFLVLWTEQHQTGLIYRPGCRLWCCSSPNPAIHLRLSSPPLLQLCSSAHHRWRSLNLVYLCSASSPGLEIILYTWSILSFDVICQLV